MVATLHAGDLGALRHLIADRNANYGTWGFKVPVIYTHLRPEQLPLFDNPHLIVPFRDIVSISVRKSLSEYKDTMHALREAVVAGIAAGQHLQPRRSCLAGPPAGNRRHYIGHARQTFRGILEGVVDDWIHGWCQLIGDLAPVLLEVHIDGRVVTSMPADMFRQDLADAGIGEGRHGFRVDLRPFGPPPDAVIKIKVARWSDELENSGRRLAQYRARTA